MGNKTYTGTVGQSTAVSPVDYLPSWWGQRGPGYTDTQIIQKLLCRRRNLPWHLAVLLLTRSL